MVVVVTMAEVAIFVVAWIIMDVAHCTDVAGTAACADVVCSRAVAVAENQTIRTCKETEH